MESCRLTPMSKVKMHYIKSKHKGDTNVCGSPQARGYVHQKLVTFFILKQINI